MTNTGGEGTWGKRRRTLTHEEILMAITKATVVANATKEIEFRYVEELTSR